MIFKDLFEYRELLKSSVKKDIRGKYKGSFLGILWSFINPLLQVAVYAIVFPLLLRNKEPHYVTFLICGIIPWNFFTSVINQGTSCVISNGPILKKIYFPREILPISVATSGLVNFCIQLLIIVLFLLGSKIGLSVNFFWFPLIAVTEYLFALALVFIISSLCVYMRDLEYIVGFFLNLAFYASPIFYSSTALKGTNFEWVMKTNPLAVIITNYRRIFIEKLAPDFSSLGIILAASAVVCLAGFMIFKTLEKGFAEEV